MSKILVAGAAGNLGSRCADYLLNKWGVAAQDLIVTTSGDTAKLQKYADLGVEVRQANYNGDQDKLVEAFSGVDTVVLISVPFVGERRRAAHKNAVDACVKAGVNKVVYTSIVGSAFDDNEGYEIYDHKIFDRYLLQLVDEGKIHAVILRNAQYAEAVVGMYEQALQDGTMVIKNNFGEGKMAYVSRDDCANMAAACAAGRGALDAIYYPQGPEALTFQQLLDRVNPVTGKDVTYQFVTDEEDYAIFDALGVPRTTEGEWGEAAANFPYCSDGMVSFGREIRLGRMCVETNDYEEVTGEKPLSVAQIFADLENHRVGERVSTDD